MKGFEQVPTIFDERYCTDAAYTISTSKQREVVTQAVALNLLEMHSDSFDREKTIAEIQRIHTKKYVDAILSGTPAKLAQSQGFHWTPQFADSVLRIWSGQAAAANLAMEKGLVFHPVSGAHHAEANRGNSFCTFNFLVGVSNSMLENGLSRVGVVDLDAHHGNGTLGLASPGTSLFDICGELWVPHTNTIDRICLVATDDRQYFRHLHGFLSYWLDANKPEFVQYQAGMDCYEHDSVGGIHGMTLERLAERDWIVLSELMKRNIPTVVNVAGGYVEDGVSVTLHVNTVKIMSDTLMASEFTRRN